MRPRNIRRSVAAVLLAATIAGGTTTPAAAGNEGADGDVSVAGHLGAGGPEVTLTGVQSDTTVTGPGLPEWMGACRWEEMTLLEYETYVYKKYPILGPPTAAGLVESGKDPDQSWAVVTCDRFDEAVLAHRPEIAFTGVLDAWPISDTPPQFVLDWMVARSRASIDIPVTTGVAAPHGGPDAPMITQFDTWLWVDDSIWQPVSVTPSAVFGTTVTVTAEPYSVVFEGDGEFVDCGDNIGAVYDFDRAEHDQSTRCALTYRHSSAVGTYTLSATIKWRVTYECSRYCGSGSLPDFVMTASRPVRVAELQAIGVAPGG